MNVNLVEIQICEAGGPLPYDWTPPPWLVEPPKLLYPEFSRPDSLLGRIRHSLPFRLAIHKFTHVFRQVIPHGIIGWGIAQYAQSLYLGLAGMAFTAAGKILATRCFKHCVRPQKLSPGDVNAIVNKLLQNPLFENAWRQMERSNPGREPQVYLVKSDVFAGYHLDETSLKLARCDTETNRIEIWEGLSKTDALQSILFESMNLWQVSRFKAVDAKIQTVSQEAYTWMTERIEHDSLLLSDQILEYGVLHLNWDKEIIDTLFAERSWKNHWQDCNATTDGLRHSNHYRRVWMASQSNGETQNR